MYGEEGEFEHDEELLATINNLDEETRKKFENGELSMDDLKGLGILPADAEDYGDEYDEEGEAESEEIGEE